MPLRLQLIYLLCCLIDIAGLALRFEGHSIVSAMPALCLLTFYYLRRRGEYKLKDYTYSMALIFAAGADIAYEFKDVNSKVISLILYVLCYSFLIATVRRDSVLGTSRRELPKVIVSMVLIITPILLISPDIPSEFFFSSLIYMVFLALLYVTALLRKANKSSYYWFLAGSLGFATLTLCEVYFTFAVKVPYSDYIIKLMYEFAQYATFIGIIKTFRSFYPAAVK